MHHVNIHKYTDIIVQFEYRNCVEWDELLPLVHASSISFQKFIFEKNKRDLLMLTIQFDSL